MATFESMDRPLSASPATNERRFWVERNKTYGNAELWVQRVGATPIVVATLNETTGRLVLNANGGDGSGSGLKRNASGYVVVDQGGVDLNGPPVN